MMKMVPLRAAGNRGEASHARRVPADDKETARGCEGRSLQRGFLIAERIEIATTRRNQTARVSATKDR
jgi:hypothetical protein